MMWAVSIGAHSNNLRTNKKSPKSI